jgi:hypothetical protein
MQGHYIMSSDNNTAIAMYKTKNLSHCRGFDPGIFCSWGERDAHYATPSGYLRKSLKFLTSMKYIIQEKH